MNAQNAKYVGVIKEEDVKQFNHEDYYKVGKGFEIFILKDGTKQLFIDSYSSGDEIGYLIENDMMIDSLEEVFLNVYKNIVDGKIVTYGKKNN